MKKYRLAVFSLLVACILAALLGSDGARWRVEVVGLRAGGELADLSWRELLAMIRPGSPYYLRDLSKTPNPFVVIKNPYNAPADRSVGQALFKKHCANCHGLEANGGAHGPSLVAGRLDHGESDWSIFRVTQRGVPGTAMQGVMLGDRDRWQVVAFLQGLRSGSAPGNEVAYEFPPNLNVGAERIRSASEEPNNWLT